MGQIVSGKHALKKSATRQMNMSAADGEVLSGMRNAEQVEVRVQERGLDCYG
jgi:hypothetical protein